MTGGSEAGGEAEMRRERSAAHTVRRGRQLEMRCEEGSDVDLESGEKMCVVLLCCVADDCTHPLGGGMSEEGT